MLMSALKSLDELENASEFAARHIGPDAADEQQADSIALSTHGRAAVERMGLGSVADELIRHAKVSVLVHRPTRGEEPQSGDARASFASTGGGSAPA